MTIDEAATFVAFEGGPLTEEIADPLLQRKVRGAGAPAVLRDQEVYHLLYRMAAKRLHPDTNRGNAATAANWERLAEAKRLLDQRFHAATSAAVVTD